MEGGVRRPAQQPEFAEGCATTALGQLNSWSTVVLWDCSVVGQRGESCQAAAFLSRGFKYERGQVGGLHVHAEHSMVSKRVPCEG